MNAERVKSALNYSIWVLEQHKKDFCKCPGKDLTRDRKLPFEKTVSTILSFHGGTINHDLLDFFRLDPALPTSSAFIQQLAKINPEAFEALFHFFTNRVAEANTYRGLRLLPVDGSGLQIAPDSHDTDSYFPGTNDQKVYGLLHINALYDLRQQLYLDAIVQKRRKYDESGALTAMIDRSPLDKALVIADQGYESYNNLAHIQDNNWFFLVRIKNGTGGIVSGLALPDSDSFDIPFHLHMTRKQTNATKQLLKDKNISSWFPPVSGSISYPLNAVSPIQHFYDLHFRIIRFPISDSLVETIITNLPEKLFPAYEIKRLYSLR